MIAKKTPEPVLRADKILSDFFNGVRNPLKGDFITRTWALRQDNFSHLTSDSKGTYVIWPFPFDAELFEKTENISIYLAFNISLLSNDQIQETNIKIFKEDITKTKIDGLIQTELLLRAEWTNANTNNKSTHAHPHWHIHSYKIVDFVKDLPSEKQKTILELIMDERGKEISDVLEDSADITEPSEERSQLNHNPELHTFKFHLAMLAEWDKQTGSDDGKILTTETLDVWLPKCLNYIKGQLQYAIKKL